MATIYKPLELVHAHLPAAPVVPHNIREISVTGQPKLPSTDSPLHREHASSAAFDPVHGVLARVVDNGQVLELRPLNLHRQKDVEDPIRIAFPDQLFPVSNDGCFASTAESFCLVVAAGDTFYRITFPVRPRLSFKTAPGWVESWLTDEEITPWLALSDEVVVMTALDGSLISMTRANASTREFQRHRPAVSRLRLPSFIAGKKTDEQAVSLARHGELIYTLSGNGRLRVWRADRGENVRIIDLEMPIESDAQHIRIVPHPSPTRYSHLVVVHKPESFVVYRATDNGELVPGGERAARGGRLCSFEVVNDGGYRLHATFDRGVIEHESIAMDDIFQFTTQVHADAPEWSSTLRPSENLDAAYFDSLLGASPPDPTVPYGNDDIPHTFLEHLFHPGRFSPRTLITALADYLGDMARGQYDGSALSAEGNLYQQYASIVGSQVMMQLSPQTGAPMAEDFRQSLKREWLKVAARARELDRQGRWPIGSSTWGDQAFSITREGVSAPVLQDVAGVVERFAESGTPFGRMPFEALTDPKLRSALVAIASAGDTLTHFLEAEAHRPLKDLSAELQGTMREGLQEAPEDLGARLWEDHLEAYVTEGDRAQLRAALSDCFDVPQALEEALRLLADFDGSEGEQRYSGLGNALFASAIQLSIINRQRYAQSILLLVLFCLSESDDTPFELVSQSLDTWHRYDVLLWVASQPASEATKVVKRKDDIASNLSGLNVEEREMDGYDTSSSLLHHLLSSQLPAYGFDLSQAAAAWLSAVHNDETFALSILKSGLPILAGEYAYRLPASPGIMYIRGRAALVAGDTQTAVANFEKAASGTNNGSLCVVLPDVRTPFDYHRHIALLCAKENQHGPTLYFGQNALRLVPDSPFKPLWVAVFQAAEKLGRYEQAYAVVAATPNEEWQTEFLAKLVDDMCAHRQIGRLTALGFVNLAHKVEEHLSFLARGSDLVKSPHFYQILYSWYIARGDYRSAADIMYQQAQRYRQLQSAGMPDAQALVEQGKSLMAAINALQLVEKRNAWITVTDEGRRMSPENLQAWKRRKITAYIPHEEFANDKNPKYILDVADLRAEYAMVLAKLRIGGRVPMDYTVEQTPADIVAMALRQGMFDLALSTASQGFVEMDPIFTSLATRCVELAGSSTQHPLAAYLYESPITSRLKGSPGAVSLRYLEIALKQYDSAATHFAYRTAVAETFFSLHSNKRNGWRMPAWLVSWEMERNPEGWIGMAVKWGWVEEAVDWCSELLRRVPPPELLPKDRADVAAIPYNLFDRVLAAVKEGDEKDDKRVQVKATALRQAIDRRLVGLRRLEGR